MHLIKCITLVAPAAPCIKKQVIQQSKAVPQSSSSTALSPLESYMQSILGQTVTSSLAPVKKKIQHNGKPSPSKKHLLSSSKAATSPKGKLASIKKVVPLPQQLCTDPIKDERVPFQSAFKVSRPPPDLIKVVDSNEVSLESTASDCLHDPRDIEQSKVENSRVVSTVADKDSETITASQPSNGTRHCIEHSCLTLSLSLSLTFPLSYPSIHSFSILQFSFSIFSAIAVDFKHKGNLLRTRILLICGMHASCSLATAIYVRLLWLTVLRYPRKSLPFQKKSPKQKTSFISCVYEVVSKTSMFLAHQMELLMNGTYIRYPSNFVILARQMCVNVSVMTNTGFVGVIHCIVWGHSSSYSQRSP